MKSLQQTIQESQQINEGIDRALSMDTLTPYLSKGFPPSFKLKETIDLLVDGDVRKIFDTWRQSKLDKNLMLKGSVYTFNEIKQYSGDRFDVLYTDKKSGHTVTIKNPQEFLEKFK